MAFLDPPPSAAWSHRDARTGFEVVFVQPTAHGHVLTGCTTALEDGHSWVVRYEVLVDSAWRTRRAEVVGRAPGRSGAVLLEADGEGGWRLDGRPAPHLGGCLDVDLESSAMTNALPVHRLALAVGDTAPAPAAYVRALDLGVQRLEQDYTRLDDQLGRQRFGYRAPAFDFSCRLVYDETGFVVSYPGIAVRAG